MKNMKFVWISLLAVSLTSPLMAQETGGRRESTKGAVIKGRAPVSDEVLKVTFPKPREAVLDNGLTVMVMEDHRLPSVLFQFQILHGSFADPENLPGLAETTAGLLKEGAGDMNSLQIAEQLDRMGAEFFADAEFGTDVTNVGISGLSEHSADLILQLADIVLRPTFPQDEFEQYRKRELAALQQARAQSNFLTEERFMAALYPDHPASKTSSSEAALSAMTREDLVRFHKTYYVPNDAVLAVTGDVSFDEVLEQIKVAFGSWQKSQVEKSTLADIKTSDNIRILLVNRPDSVQTSLRLGNVGIAYTDEDQVKVAVMNQIFGASSSSRLFLILREEKGYTYGAYSRFSMDTYPGPWMAFADVRTDVTEGALGEFINQINRLRDDPVGDEELSNAKGGLVARFALSLARSRSVTGRALRLKRYGLPADYWDTLPARVEAVSADEIQAMAKKYLDPDNLVIVAVGDGEKIRDILAKFGEVSEYDVEGNLVTE